MRTILYIVRKEFMQIFRHRIMVPLIFLMPIVQLLILANAADYEVRNISLHLIDNDLSSASQRLSGKFNASRHFNVVRTSFSSKEGLRDLETNTADLFIEIPANFERDLIKEGEAVIHITINAINGVKAGLGNAYANAIIQDFGAGIRAEWLSLPVASQPGLAVEFSNWFNPELEYDTFMVPGILVMLVTLVGMFLSGMNIVKEKEIGTIEQINVTPIRKSQFIAGKFLPFWIIGLVELAFGLLVGKLVFDIPMEGSLALVFGFAAIYLLVVLGIGLLISTFTETQQQAMFIAWFFLVVFILMSGLFTPIESMPLWAQKLTLLNPIAYFVDVMRLVLLKGSGFWEISRHFTVMLVYGLAINALAVLNYRKTTG
jgi:ABC-2 type transport system permease protein